MPTIETYAKLANAIYSDDVQVGEWTRARHRAGLSSGLEAAVYTRGTAQVVSFKGTTTPDEVVADAKLGLGMNTTYYWEAEAFVKKYATAAEVYLTGHSLGGAIAQIVGHRRELPFVTFNAPGVGLVATKNILYTPPHMTAIRTAGSIFSTFRHPIQAYRDARSVFHKNRGINYRLSGDVVSRTGVHYGKVKTISGARFGWGIAQHKMGNMVTAILEGGPAAQPFPEA